MPLLTFRGWNGGVNRLLPSDQLGDTEVVRAENMELDSRANLRTRPGTSDVSGSTTLTKRPTSIFYFERSNGSTAVFASEDNDIRRWDGVTSWPALSIDGAQASYTSLPTDKTWYWVVFNDKAIGVNGDTTGGTVGNAVKVDSTLAGATLKDLSVDAAQPKFKYIDVGNNRVFGVDADSPNTLVASKLGDAETADAWSATGIAGFYSANIGGDEGGRITGIKLYQNQLVVFKRRRIYAVTFGSPNTDTSQWEIRQLVNNVGCISQNSVQEVLGDLIFLSDEGLMSLRRLVSAGGDVERALLSENVPALRQVPRSREDYPATIIPSKSQYLISIPTTDNAVNDITWVMDYAQLSVNGSVSFTEWTGGPTGSILSSIVDSNGSIRTLIGKEVSGGTSAIHLLRDDNQCTNDGASCFQDAGVAYTSDVLFKAMNFDEPLVRKVLHRWGIEFGALTDPVALDVFLSIDGNDPNARSWPVQFSGLVSGGTWDVDLWDTATWASEVSPNTDVWRKVAGVRRFQQFQLRVKREVIDQGITVKNLSIEVSRLTNKRAGDV
jgi:hypothetical protein